MIRRRNSGGGQRIELRELSVFLLSIARERLSKRVANRIWVAETLAFDDFYRVITEFEG